MYVNRINSSVKKHTKVRVRFILDYLENTKQIFNPKLYYNNSHKSHIIVNQLCAL